MRKRALIASAAVIIITIVGVVVWPGKKEPEYKGKRLSEWAALQQDQPSEATTALLAIGTNGLPTIISWIDYDLPRWRTSLIKISSNMPKSWAWRGRIYKWLADEGLNRRVQNADFCFKVLGEQGRPAIPELKRLIRDGRFIRPGCAAQALASMEGDGVLALVELLDDRTLGNAGRLAAVRTLRSVEYRGPELKKAVPALLSCLQDTNSWVQAFAAQSLGHFGCGHQQAVPALAQLTLSPSPDCRMYAAQALRQFGPDAIPALSAVSNLTHDSDERVRIMAEKALEKIMRPR